VTYVKDESGSTPVQVTVAIDSSKSYSYKLTELDAYTRYLISVTSMSSTGSIGVNSVHATTLQSVPSAPVQNLTRLEASSTSVDIVWMFPARDHWNGIINQYNVEVTRVRDSSIVITTDITNQWYTVENLEANTAYTISVRAGTSVGLG
ncbi:fibronectin type III domain-containing protein, partial [Salmonella sp. s51228]|uniref:fibronectin type III domain-containing protein n=1 Tax=Salmonella sp. s51228 TaxID=3159652 RepID=UPI0039812323